MSEALGQEGSGFSRRDFLLSGGSLLTGLAVGGIGEHLRTDASGELEALKLWQAREKVLNDIFFSNDPSYLHTVVDGRVTIPAGEVVQAFPASSPNYTILESYEESGPFNNEGLVLDRQLFVDNPIIMGGGVSSILPGATRWMLVNGPEGAGYVAHKNGEGALGYQDVLPGSYWSGKGDDGKLRFTASGFAYRGETSFGSDDLPSDFYLDLKTDRLKPMVQRLGEGMQSSEVVRISETVPVC